MRDPCPARVDAPAEQAMPKATRGGGHGRVRMQCVGAIMLDLAKASGLGTMRTLDHRFCRGAMGGLGGSPAIPQSWGLPHI